MVKPTVEVRDLTAGYWLEQPVLEQLTLSITGPGWFLLSGSNGSGKSTLFEVIAGYLQFSGAASVCGVPVREGARVATVKLQRADPAFVPGVTLRDHFALHAARYGVPRTRLETIAHDLQLDEHLDKAPESVSTGTLRKAWFVAHCAGAEPVWCLDEPFNGVDAQAVQTMLNYMDEAAQERLVLLTSHLLPEHVESQLMTAAGAFQVERLTRCPSAHASTRLVEEAGV